MLFRSALNVNKVKIESKAIKSVRSRVCNIKDKINREIDIYDLRDLILDEIFASMDIQLYELDEEDIKNIENLVKEKYGTWEFNYGYSPAFTAKNKIKIEGCGLIEAVMNVKEGRIKNINIRGDYFSLKETSELENILTGLRYKKEDVEDVFKDIDIGEYILNITNKDFISLLFN